MDQPAPAQPQDGKQPPSGHRKMVARRASDRPAKAPLPKRRRRNRGDPLPEPAPTTSGKPRKPLPKRRRRKKKAAKKPRRERNPEPTGPSPEGRGSFLKLQREKEKKAKKSDRRTKVPRHRRRVEVVQEDGQIGVERPKIGIIRRAWIGLGIEGKILLAVAIIIVLLMFS